MNYGRGPVSWWHSYGQIMPDGDPEFPGLWVQMTMGPVDYDPDDPHSNGRPVRDPLHLPDGTELPYLGSFDHEPTDEEKGALEPDDEGEEPWATCARDQGGCGGNLLGEPVTPECKAFHAKPYRATELRVGPRLNVCRVEKEVLSG